MVSIQTHTTTHTQNIHSTEKKKTCVLSYVRVAIGEDTVSKKSNVDGHFNSDHLKFNADSDDSKDSRANTSQ